MDLSLAKKAGRASEKLTKTQLNHMYAKEALKKELTKYGYDTSEETITRAIQAAGDDTIQMFDVASGRSTNQWCFRRGCLDCDNYGCCYYGRHPNRVRDDSGSYINIFTSEKYCDVCFDKKHSDTDDIPTVSELLAKWSGRYMWSTSFMKFEWHELGKKNAAPCSKCKTNPAAHRYRRSNYVLCDECFHTDDNADAFNLLFD